MGGGGLRMLALAARHADVVSINVRLDAGKLGPERGATATRSATEQKLAVVKTAANERFDDLVLQVEEHYVDITNDRGGAMARAGRALGLAPEEIAASPHVLIGSVAEVCDRLDRQRGARHLLPLHERGRRRFLCPSRGQARRYLRTPPRPLTPVIGAK